MISKKIFFNQLTVTFNVVECQRKEFPVIAYVIATETPVSLFLSLILELIILQRLNLFISSLCLCGISAILMGLSCYYANDNVLEWAHRI